MDASKRGISAELVERLLGALEDYIGEVAALRTVLQADADVPDWREAVETQKILHADRLRHKFAPFRALILATPNENLPPDDLDSVVRRILDSALKPDDPIQ